MALAATPLRSRAFALSVQSASPIYMQACIWNCLLKPAWLKANVKMQIQRKKERGRYANRPMREPGTGSKRSSEQGHRADALALGADERRDKLRKAAVRSKYPLTRRSLNGETPLDRLQRLCSKSIAAWREPGELKHLSSRRKRKKHRFPE